MFSSIAAQPNCAVSAERQPSKPCLPEAAKSDEVSAEKKDRESENAFEKSRQVKDEEIYRHST